MHRLANLFSSNDLFLYLNENGVIAGGSVVYALNEFVPRETVSDIDVFINNKETFLEVFNYIHQEYSVKQCFYINGYFGPTTKDVHDNIIGIVEIHLDDGNIPIQLILQGYSSPMEVIQSFDLDYVQCAYHQDELFITKYCRKSHHRRRVLRGMKFPPVYNCLLKAHHKGFKTPLLGIVDKNADKRPLLTMLTLDILGFIIKSPKNRRVFNFKDVIVESAHESGTLIRLGELTAVIEDKVLSEHHSVNNETSKEQKILNLIDKHRSILDKLSHAKVSAYECYLYHREEDEQLAINKSCMQLEYDTNKRNSLSYFETSMDSIQIDTVDEMIDFIEGFN